jgi:hypothetical protein
MPAAKPAKPASKPSSKQATKPASKPSSKPPTKSASKPASKPATKPASKPASKPATKSASKPATKSASKPATKPASKPATKSAAKTAGVRGRRVVGGGLFGSSKVSQQPAGVERSSISENAFKEMYAKKQELVRRRSQEEWQQYVHINPTVLGTLENNINNILDKDEFDDNDVQEIRRLVCKVSLARQCKNLTIDRLDKIFGTGPGRPTIDNNRYLKWVARLMTQDVCNILGTVFTVPGGIGAAATNPRNDYEETPYSIGHALNADLDSWGLDIFDFGRRQ